MLDNAVVSGVDDDGDSGLRHPREGLGQEVVQPVEVPAGEAELVSDGAGGVEIVENALVPLGNRGVELEPHPLEVRSFGEGDFQRGRASGRLPSVVGIASYRASTLETGEPETSGDRRAMDGTFIGNKSTLLKTAKGPIVNLDNKILFTFAVVCSTLPPKVE